MPLDLEASCSMSLRAFNAMHKHADIVPTQAPYQSLSTKKIMPAGVMSPFIRAVPMSHVCIHTYSHPFNPAFLQFPLKALKPTTTVAP